MASSLPLAAYAFVIEEPIEGRVHAYPYTHNKCDLKQLQYLVGGNIESCPPATNASFVSPEHISSRVKSIATSLTAYVNEEAFMVHHHRNDSGERLLMALGFHVNLLYGIYGPIVITRDGMKKLSPRLVHMLQRGFEVASAWDENDTDGDNHDDGQDPEIKRIRSAMDDSLNDTVSDETVSTGRRAKRQRK